MKITVIKKATNAKPSGFCSTFVDDGLLEQEVELPERPREPAPFELPRRVLVAAWLLVVLSVRPGVGNPPGLRRIDASPVTLTIGIGQLAAASEHRRSCSS